MANWYVSSVAWAAVPAWTAAAPATIGDFIRPTAPAAGREYVYRCTTGGTTGGAQPTWGLTANGTTNDNDVVWTECTGQEAYNSAANWTAPGGTLATIMHVTTGRGATGPGDYTFVASDHSETGTALLDLSKGGNILCVTVAGSAVPPTAASLTTGAAVATTGAANIQLSGELVIVGVAFSIGSAASTASLVIGRSAVSITDVQLRNCSITLANTSASSRVTLGSTSYGCLTLTNTPISFGAAGQSIRTAIAGSTLAWFDTASAVGGTTPTNLFDAASGAIPVMVALEGLDLSAFPGTIIDVNIGSNTTQSIVSLRNCLLHASVTPISAARLRGGAARLEMDNCDSASGSPIRMFRAGVRGQTTTAGDPVRTGGASANGVGVSWRITPNTAANTAPTAAMPLASPWIFKNNAATGGAITLTMHALANKASKPDSNMMWAQASYMGAAGSARWNKAAPNAPPALPAVSPAAGIADNVSAWDSATPARANTAVYSLGDTIKVASNPGRVFFCINPGASAGSEPAGYATAVDGDTVVDNTADFRAGWRLSFAVTVTPQVEGLVGMRAYLVDSETTPTAVYVDPTITVS